MTHPHSTSLKALQEHLNQTLLGQSQTITLFLAALLAGGHVLLEDRPGTGKTTLARSLAASFSAKFHRVQFTPDLMPSDITGNAIYHPKDEQFHFHPGPVFCDILLADEINRASPRTQSALLEAMEERQISTDSFTHALPSSFFVIATENPLDFQGTYPLPEAQLDRFMVRLSLGYVSLDNEIAILSQALTGQTPSSSSASSFQPLPLSTLVELQQQALQVSVSEPMLRYMTQLVQTTRSHDAILMGASVRGTLSLLRMSQALAFLENQSFVTHRHVQTCFYPTMAHRLILKNTSTSLTTLLNQILSSVTLP